MNREGWIATADHIVAEILKFSDSQRAIQEHESHKKLIEADAGLKEHEKHRRIQRLPVSDEWITHQAAMWGRPQWTVNTFFRDPLADVAIGQITGFDPAQISEYPIFKNPNIDYRSGTSLCRLGFPFHEIKATFKEASGTFDLDPATFPVPLFPNDGILTRFVMRGAPDHSRQARFIETSTAGLRGQSGGPIFDRHGLIYAIQSQTISLPLGIAPTIT